LNMASMPNAFQNVPPIMVIRNNRAMTGMDTFCHLFRRKKLGDVNGNSSPVTAPITPIVSEDIGIPGNCTNSLTVLEKMWFAATSKK
jgi:hypothetical protein